jgi:hypothetical protein
MDFRALVDKELGLTRISGKTLKKRNLYVQLPISLTPEGAATTIGEELCAVRKSVCVRAIAQRVPPERFDDRSTGRNNHP